MPAEAHRFERRLRRRDWRFLAALGCAAAVGTAGGVIATARGSGDAPRPACVSFEAAGVMGGGTWRFCGADAAAYCAAHAADSRKLAEQCDRLKPGK